MKKTCSRCKVEKETSEFRKGKRYKDGFFCWCNGCFRDYARERERTVRVKDKLKQRHQEPEVKKQREDASKRWHRRNPERSRAIHRNGFLRNQYGITQKDYDLLLIEQGGVCACCGKQPVKRLLNVDHDHDTGKVRGLLCYSCNRGIGLLGDSREGLARALDYLTTKEVNPEPFTFIA